MGAVLDLTGPNGSGIIPHMANIRNKPCECGSGKKRKLCLCWQIEEAHEAAIREDEWRTKWADPEYRERSRAKVWGLVALTHMIAGR